MPVSEENNGIFHTSLSKFILQNGEENINELQKYSHSIVDNGDGISLNTQLSQTNEWRFNMYNYLPEDETGICLANLQPREERNGIQNIQLTDGIQNLHLCYGKGLNNKSLLGEENKLGLTMKQSCNQSLMSSYYINGRNNKHTHLTEEGIEAAFKNLRKNMSYSEGASGTDTNHENLRYNLPNSLIFNYGNGPLLTEERKTFLWDDQSKRESSIEDVPPLNPRPAQEMFSLSKNLTAPQVPKNVEISMNNIPMNINFTKEMNKSLDYTYLSSFDSSGSSYYDNSDTTLSEDDKDMLVESYVKKIESLKEELPQSFNNGQMMCGPPKNWIGPPPGEGTEIFISKLPRKIDLDKLYNFVSSTTGFSIYTLRLMINISKVTNRGYCFVRFYTKENAEAAQQMLDRAEIISGNMLRVSMSIDNKRLIIKNIPRNLSEAEVMTCLKPQMAGVEKIIILADSDQLNKNRGFVFADFVDHRSADVCRRALKTCGVFDWRTSVICDWVRPTKAPLIQAPKLFVRNLIFLTEANLRSLLLQNIDESNIKYCRKIKDYAFIHFTDFETAKLALSILNGLKINGITIFAEWAKPPSRD